MNEKQPTITKKRIAGFRDNIIDEAIKYMEARFEQGKNKHKKVSEAVLKKDQKKVLYAEHDLFSKICILQGFTDGFYEIIDE